MVFCVEVSKHDHGLQDVLDFFGSGHGKSPNDKAGAVIKRFL